MKYSVHKWYKVVFCGALWFTVMRSTHLVGKMLGNPRPMREPNPMNMTKTMTISVGDSASMTSVTMLNLAQLGFHHAKYYMPSAKE